MALSRCRCGGEGSYEKDGKLYECICAAVRRIGAAMPEWLRKTEVQPRHLSLPIVGMTQQMVHVNGTLDDVLAVVKIVMIKNMKLSIHLTSDREIRDVFVGSTSRAAKGANEDGVLNSLQDLMEPSSLVIVRLNELKYKNKAAPGALQEALSYRTDRKRPTWLVVDSRNPFGQGSPAYSEELQGFIDEHFMKVVIPSTEPAGHNQATIAPRVLSSAQSVAPSTVAPTMNPVVAAPRKEAVKKTVKPALPAPSPIATMESPFILDEDPPAAPVEEEDPIAGYYATGVPQSKSQGRSSFKKSR